MRRQSRLSLPIGEGDERSTHIASPVADNPSHGSGDRWFIAAAACLTITSITPNFLVGALSTQLRADLDFSITALGAVVALFNVAAASASVVMGRLADRYGAAVTAFCSMLVTCSAMAAIGLVANGWTLLAVFMCLAGMGHAAAHPAANAILAHRVSDNRLGFALGIKQASVPAAGTLAGLAVPVASIWLGWRATFALAAVLSLTLFVFRRAYSGSVTRRNDRSSSVEAHSYLPPSPNMRRTGLLTLTVAAAFATAAVASLSVFLVQATVERGVSVANAGLLLAVASLGGVCGRTVAGWRTDRRSRRHLVVVAQMMGVGAVALAILGIGADWMQAPAAVLAFGFGWSWNGVLHFAVIRLHPDAPALASSVIQAGLFLGGGLGPLGFGAVAEHLSFRVAWLMAAGQLAVAGVIILLGRRLLAAAVGQYPRS